MRVPAAIISLVFCSLIQHTTCTCSVNCTTDYISSLNCSCTGPGLAPSYHLKAECSDEGDQMTVDCEIITPQHWCILVVGSYDFDIGAFTKCTVEANDELGVEPNDSTDLTLYENIKPQPPFNVLLIESYSSYNISWEMAYTEDINSYLNTYLIYKVQLRIKDEKPKYYDVYEDRRYLEIPSSILTRGKEYVVAVQAKMNPHRFPTSFWSEWSPTVQWKTKHGRITGEEETNHYMLYFLLLLIVPCVLCFFGRSRLRKVHVYIPSPEFFFRPLYYTHEGDFKKWVGPTSTFSESDFLEKDVVNEKQIKSLERLCEGEGEDSASMTSLGGTRGGSCSQGPESSAGHISIDTVMVLEEESGNSHGSQDPYRHSRRDRFTYPPFSPGRSVASEGVGLLGAEGVISGGLMSRGAEISVELSSHLVLDGLESHLHNAVIEPDQSSLESFSFTERSEDGYPSVAMDMDTIDSGFQESNCGSPVHSDLDIKEQMDAAVMAEAQCSHTNYIKQWVATTSPSAPQVDSSS
ncbi:hypothetical protein AAFF_G00405290 [Aldrovandia affinis]|uniref:Fibronectin type-III domain-containing protein n=1 Tax=Aldrovandia affinis TaxID=143900 RepID=A0AAD7SC88_9TELE|nr:hypothetical protein AAFF_G00405290 [Aldrovandia affinis]